MVHLAGFLAAHVDRFEYVYDMGDDWRHQIEIECVEHAEPGGVYPELRGGARRCPPEDCGGVPGYHEFLKMIAAPDNGPGSRLKKRMLASLSEGAYDPEDMAPRKSAQRSPGLPLPDSSRPERRS